MRSVISFAMSVSLLINICLSTAAFAQEKETRAQATVKDLGALRGDVDDLRDAVNQLKADLDLIKSLITRDAIEKAQGKYAGIKGKEALEADKKILDKVVPAPADIKDQVNSFVNCLKDPKCWQREGREGLESQGKQLYKELDRLREAGRNLFEKCKSELVDKKVIQPGFYPADQAATEQLIKDLKGAIGKVSKECSQDLAPAIEKSQQADRTMDDIKEVLAAAFTICVTEAPGPWCFAFPVIALLMGLFQGGGGEGKQGSGKDGKGKSVGGGDDGKPAPKGPNTGAAANPNAVDLGDPNGDVLCDKAGTAWKCYLKANNTISVLIDTVPPKETNGAYNAFKKLFDANKTSGKLKFCSSSVTAFGDARIDVDGKKFFRIALANNSVIFSAIPYDYDSSKGMCAASTSDEK